MGVPAGTVTLVADTTALVPVSNFPNLAKDSGLSLSVSQEEHLSPKSNLRAQLAIVGGTTPVVYQSTTNFDSNQPLERQAGSKVAFGSAIAKMLIGPFKKAERGLSRLTVGETFFLINVI